MNGIIAITGTPAAGKSMLADLLRKRCKNADVIEINDVVKRQKAYSRRDGSGSLIVDMRKLNRAVRRIVSGNEREGRPTVLVGHLAPELSLRYNIAVVTRAKLVTLLGRLRKRGYNEEKIRENIEAEALDYCGEKIRGRCKEIYEVESSKDKKEVLDYLISLCGGIRQKRPKENNIDKLGEFYKLVKKGALKA